MKRIRFGLTLVILMAGSAAFAQGPGRGPRGGCGPNCDCPPAASRQTGARAPIASNAIVEVKGKITKVQLIPGQGMPSLEVDQGGQTSKVILGSMRYLMQQNFNPKAGDTVSVRGYRAGTEIYAIEVGLAGGASLRLRDDAGWPVWQGRGRMGRCGCCAQQ
jgi:hypothetical protein